MQQYTSQDEDKFPEVIGIYKISFKNGSGKSYIGSSASLDISKYKRGIKTRWKNHLSKLRLNIHHSKKLQNAFNKYGEESIIFEILETLHMNNVNHTRERESYYINEHNSIKVGYNTIPPDNTCLGYKRPQEIIEKIKSIHRLKNRQPHEDDVLSMVKTCKNCIEIAKSLNISHNIVRRILKDNKVEAPKNGEYRIKRIYAYSLNGDFIGEWESAKVCAKELNLKSVCTISHVAAKKLISYKNMWFSYEFLDKDTAKDKILERVLEGKKKMSDGTKTRERLKKEKVTKQDN